MGRILSATLTILGLTVPLPAGQEQELGAALRAARARVEKHVERGAAASIAVGVGRNGQVLWAEAFGLADVERGIEARTSTPYPVASLTKSITGTGLALLAAEERVDLDAPVERYLGEGALRVFEGTSEDVTVRRVLVHEAGIPHGWESYPWSAEETRRERSDLTHALVAFPPGSGFLYSNYAYGVAAAVLGRASGKGYAAFLQERLFAPLGMDDGGPAITAELVARAAVQYDGARNPIAPARFVPVGGAGAYASVDDLLRYGFFHLGDLDLPSESSVRAAAASRFELPRGFACTELAEGLTWVLSNGRFSGASSNITLLPGEGLVVCVLANAGTMLADELATSIVDDLVPGFAARAKAFVRRYEAAQALEAYEPVRELVGDWYGRIATPARDVPFTLTFEQEGEVWLTWDDAHEGRLRALRGGPARLTASFQAPLPFHPSHPGPVVIDLELVARSGHLSGAAVGAFRSEAGSFALPAHVTLERQ